MSEETLEQVEPVQQIVVEPELPEQSFSYQPTDDNGRAMGGRQVIKYKTVQELQDKLVEQNTLLIRKLREETRKNRLGQIDETVIDEALPRTRKEIRLKPRALSPEDRIKLARDLSDPDKVDEAADIIFESKFGTKAQEFAETFTDMQRSNRRLQGLVESEAFARANPDFVKCDENARALVGWMERYNLEPTRENFQLAYQTLLAADVLVTNAVPEVIPEPVVHTQVEPVAEVAPVAPVVPASAPAPVVPRIATAFNRSNSSDEPDTVLTEGTDIVYDLVTNLSDGKTQTRRFSGLDAVNAMPGDEYRRRLERDPKFGPKVIALETAAKAKKRA